MLCKKRRIQSLMRKHPLTCHQVIIPRERNAASWSPKVHGLSLSQSPSQPRQPAPTMAIREGDLQPGEFVSVEQYVCHIRVRLPHTRGKEKDFKCYSGVLIQVDRASAFMHVTNQVSLYGGKILKSENKFDNLLSGCGVEIKKYHCDNGILQLNLGHRTVRQRTTKMNFLLLGQTIKMVLPRKPSRHLRIGHEH